MYPYQPFQPYQPVNYNAMNNANSNPFNLPQTSVDEVMGRDGAAAYPMGANSSKLLMDKTAPIVWLVQTDSAGVKDLKPFDIAPHQDTQPVNLNDIESRLSRLEELYNAKSDNASTKSKKSD